MTLANASRIALLSLIVGLLAMTGIATASAQSTTPSSSAKAAARICTKRARESATSSTSTSHRRAAVRRCMVRLRRSYSRDTSPPTVAWKTPAGGATVSGKLQGAACEVSASDDRDVYRIVFKVDGTTLNTESDAPWNCIFDTTKVTDGSHTVTATAYDAAGNSSSAAQTVNVVNKVVSPGPTPEPVPAPTPEPTPTPTPTGDTTAPTVAWQVPTAASTIGGKLQGSACEVSASDDHGVEKVVFKVDGTTLNTESDAPWNCIFDTTKVTDGSHTVTATAYDAAGNSSATHAASTSPTRSPPLPRPNRSRPPARPG